jgi:hypothetical protein
MEILTENNDAIHTGHSTIHQVHSEFPHTKDYFSFTFVRNPWAKFVSLYSMWKNMEDDHSFMEWDSNQVDFCRKYSFKDFLYAVKIGHIIRAHTQPYIGHYFEKPSDISFVGKLEQYQDDFNLICDKIGIPRQKLPHENKSNHKHYTEYYDNETREIVAKKYAKDIEYFGYEFGE